LQVDFPQQQPLLQLAQLPALQHLALQYFHGAAAAAATAPTWKLLPQLRELVNEHAEGNDVDDLPTKQQWSAIMAGIATATSLTMLNLDPRMCKEEDPVVQAGEVPLVATEPCEVAPCAKLTRLLGLKELSIGSDYGVHMAPGDALAPTALTGLTRLQLWYAEHGVDASAVTAMARVLKQLQDLCLYRCDLQLGSNEGMLCYALLCCAVQCCAMLHRAAPCCALLRCAAECCICCVVCSICMSCNQFHC
jgi:hypothetical protein